MFISVQMCPNVWKYALIRANIREFVCGNAFVPAEMWFDCVEFALDVEKMCKDVWNLVLNLHKMHVLLHNLLVKCVN